jgi:hypothetical protein
MRPKISTAAPVLALTLALTGCSGSEDPNLAACDALAYYIQEADSPETMDRETTIDQVRFELLEEQPDADVDEMIASGLTTLEAGVDANDSAWALATDTMATACFDYGWTGD